MKSALLKTAFLVACATLSLLSSRAEADFQLRQQGTGSTSATLAPGANLSLEVAVTALAAEAGIEANLDSFTYRIVFPNQSFILLNNSFTAPFDNGEVPAGFNGSIPWSGLPVPINNAADAGSPAATAVVPDIYRTTATQTGTPINAPGTVESLTVQVPVAPGVYNITLNVLEAADAQGALHTADSGTGFVVTVGVDPCNPDLTPPIVTLNGASPLIVECGAAFVDPGASASDACSGVLAVSVSGTVDINTPGNYVLTYSATDAAGNPGSTIRTVTVSDTTPPTIALNGANPLIIECHTAFVDPGATAIDTCAGPLAVSTSGIVDPNTPGAYILTYSATDPAGNMASLNRTVTVSDTTAPVVTLSGASLFPISCHGPFVDPGATATDTCSGALPVTVTGSVDVNTPGDYLLTYTATDAAGLSGNAVRTVRVGNCDVFTLTCPPDTTVPTDPGTCSATVSFPDAVPTGASGAVTLVCNPPSGSSFSIGTTTVTCTGTDSIGQTATCTFTVTVEDNDPPVITCPPDQMFACLGDVPPADFAGGAVTDNCDASPVVNHVGDVSSGSNPTLITRTYEAIDASGNSRTCQQILTVTGLPGDLNGDCCVDRADLDLLLAQIRARSGDLAYDINGDNRLDIADARALALLFTNPGGAPCP